MKNADLAHLLADYQAPPTEEKPKAIDALQYLETHGVVVPPVRLKPHILCAVGIFQHRRNIGPLHLQAEDLFR